MNKTQYYLPTQEAAADIPTQLQQLFLELSRFLTKKTFQDEINCRLGALLRVSGVDCEFLPTRLSTDTESVNDNNLARIPLELTDADCDLVLRFRVPVLSANSRRSLYQTAITILSDYLKVVSLSGPTALERFRKRHPIILRRSPIVIRGASSIPQSADVNLDDIVVNDKDELMPGNPGALERDTRSGGGFTPPYLPGQFAHRLRNSLTAILSASGQLAESNQSSLHPDDRMLLQVIENAGKAQKSLIDKYLMLYGSLKLTLKQLDLKEILYSTVNQYDSQFGRKTDIATDSGTTMLTSDPRLLRQIMAELLSNAHEADGEDPISVRGNVVRDQATILVKNHNKIAVREFPDKFFEPFFTTKQGHTGLGLAIAKRYASVLGGTIKGITLQGCTVVALSLPITQEKYNNQYTERN